MTSVARPDGASAAATGTRNYRLFAMVFAGPLVRGSLSGRRRGPIRSTAICKTARELTGGLGADHGGLQWDWRAWCWVMVAQRSIAPRRPGRTGFPSPFRGRELSGFAATGSYLLAVPVTSEVVP